MSVINEQLQRELDSHIETVNDHFTPFMDAIRAHQESFEFQALFVADLKKDELWHEYLNGFTDPAMRKESDCNCCRNFFNRYGGLVTIDTANGFRSVSLLWDETKVPEQYQASVAALRQRVEGAKIRSVFYANTAQLGIRTQGNFDHLFINLQHVNPGRELHRTPATNMLKSIEDKRLLNENLQQGRTWGQDKLDQALFTFTNDKDLKHYQVHVANLSWYVNYVKSHLRTIPNVSWFNVATRSMGRLHILQTVIGEYLKHFMLGDPAYAKRLFLKMVDPKDYMRPTEAPTQANVAQASKIFDALGLAPSLERRSLRRDEIPEEAKLWKEPPNGEDAATPGVFDHLKTKDKANGVSEGAAIDGGAISWSTFFKTVLPRALQLSVRVSPGANPFASFMTAVNPDAPPLVSWDRPEQRNPVSSYVYHKGSSPEQWSLPGSHTHWEEVSCIVNTPNYWQLGAKDIKPVEDFTRSVNLVLKNGHDQNDQVLGLFPEDMRPELHEVRSTIEQYSRQGKNADNVNGFPAYVLSPGMKYAAQLKVKFPEGNVLYTVDRFE